MLVRTMTILGTTMLTTVAAELGAWAMRAAVAVVSTGL